MKNNKLIRILMYFKPYKLLLLISFGLTLIINFSDLINPYITKIIIDDYIVKKEDISILLLGGAYFFAVIIGSICQYLLENVLNLTGQKIMHKMRIELFSHLQKMSLSFFDKNASGSILTKITNDIESLNELYSGVFVQLFKDFFLLIGILSAMFMLDAKTAFICMAIVPVIVVITYFYNKRIKSNFRLVRSLIGAINAFFAENISGMKLVQLFNKEKEKYKEFKQLNDEYNKRTRIQVMLNAVFRPISELINSISISILIWVCAKAILNYEMQFGVLYAFINYSKKFFNPINDLADKYTVIQQGLVSAERVFELLDEKNFDEDFEYGVPMDNVIGKIEFKNVWFAYVDEEWVLRDVSLVINPGETVAFAGATGAGKSTIINLIGRFYKVNKGEILIDDVNINEYKLSDLRRQIAVVMQDVFLFAGDIKSNISLNNDIEIDDIITASKYVNSHEFIMKLNNGYDELVKERGATLSSGQRQLLSFARAIVFSPKILVLDEATSNIDTEHEMLIQGSLEKISKDRTTLIIAHRLSTIRDADKIVVLHKGKIREVGTHNELLNKEGYYKKLYDIQFT